MGKFQDLTGMKFGRLVVLGLAYKKPRKNGGYMYYWRCRCECGNIKIVRGECLKIGNTKSCGCLRLQILEESRTKHGLCKTNAFYVWYGAKNRCYNPNATGYENYGGRGITMYEPWINDFAAFYEYVSQLEHFGEAGYSLDRIENDENYEPGNLRWATRAEQNRNQRRNVIVEYDGQEMTLAEAAEKSGINYQTLHSRYKAGDRGEDLFRRRYLNIHFADR